MTEIAIALRSELYNVDELLDIVQLADASPRISHLFLPDIPSGQESIELSAASLALTKRLSVGSGVIRLSEYDPRILARRIETIQFLSKNRFVLGIGTGGPSPSPHNSIERMFSTLDLVRKNFPMNRDESIKFPIVLAAALRLRMARIGLERSDGLLLNFCSPGYCENLISTIETEKRKGKIVACYVKIFYSEKLKEAEKILIEEFVKYDTIPQYHSMFEGDGTSGAISYARSRLSKGIIEVPDDLKRTSLANPRKDELSSFLRKFVMAGVDLPCVYPYFAQKESTEFKLKIMKDIMSLELRHD